MLASLQAAADSKCLLSQTGLRRVNALCAELNQQRDAHHRDRNWTPARHLLAALSWLELVGHRLARGLAASRKQLQQAKRVFLQHARGPACERYLRQLEATCVKVWRDGRQLCEVVSITPSGV